MFGEHDYLARAFALALFVATVLAAIEWNRPDGGE